MIVPNRRLLQEHPGAGRLATEHYDALDTFYREIWGTHLHHGLWESGSESVQEACERLVDKVAAHAAITPGSTVCDVGCGYGETGRLLAGRYGARVTGLTISPRQYEYARARGVGPGSQILLRDWLDNGLPAEAFDAVIAIESTEHMLCLTAAFAEAARVLKPGGCFVVCAWLAAEDAPAWAVRHLLEPICREGRLNAMGTAHEYRSLIEAAGFQVDAVEDLSRQVRRTWWLVLRRVVGALLRDARYRRFLLDRTATERIFARSLLRIALAYVTGHMRYGLLAATRVAR